MSMGVCTAFYPINFYAVLCRTPQELYDTLENDLAIEKEVQNPQRD